MTASTAPAGTTPPGPPAWLEEDQIEPDPKPEQPDGADREPEPETASDPKPESKPEPTPEPGPSPKPTKQKRTAAKPAEPIAPAEPVADTPADQSADQAPPPQRRPAPGALELLEQTLRYADSVKASDVHVRAGEPIWIRRGGEFAPLDARIISYDEAQECIRHIGSVHDVRTLELGGARWRSLAMEAGCVYRRIPPEVPDLRKLNLPPEVGKLGTLPDGLVVIAGKTGSGKSTTVASVLTDVAARNRRHILTIENPVEFEILSKASLVTQQEVPAHEHTNALNSALRADPDIVLFGECRVPAHFELCLTLAATGHLVFTTVHAGDPQSVVERITSMATGLGGEMAARSLLSAVLRAVVCQRLIPSLADKRLRHCATEIMLTDKGIRTVLSDPTAKLSQISTKMKDSKLSLARSLAKMVKEEKISVAAAEAEVLDPVDLNRQLALINTAA